MVKTSLNIHNFPCEIWKIFCARTNILNLNRFAASRVTARVKLVSLSFDFRKLRQL